MPDDMSDDLRASISAAMDADGGDWGGSEPSAPAAPSEAPSGDRARDDAGRFAPKTEGAPNTAPAAAPPPPEDDYEDGIGFERDAWGRLPQDLRPTVKTIAQQRRDFEARAKGYEPLDSALNPVRDAWTMQYGGVPQALQQLIAIERVARENPAEFIRQFVSQRGMNPAQLFAQQGQQAPQQDLMDMLRAEVRQTMQAEMQQQQVATSLSQFEADAGLEHRNDPAVRKVMAGLLQTGAATDLRTAYDMAVHAAPETRAKLAQADQAARAKQDQAANAQAVQERQSAAVSTRGAPGITRAPAGSSASDNSIRAEIERQWDAQAGGRV